MSIFTGRGCRAKYRFCERYDEGSDEWTSCWGAMWEDNQWLFVLARRSPANLKMLRWGEGLTSRETARVFRLHHLCIGILILEMGEPWLRLVRLKFKLNRLIKPGSAKPFSGFHNSTIKMPHTDPRNWHAPHWLNNSFLETACLHVQGDRLILAVGDLEYLFQLFQWCLHILKGCSFCNKGYLVMLRLSFW